MDSSDFEYDDVTFNNEKILCFDASNLLYRSFYANRNIEEEHIDGLVHHQFLTILNKYYKQFKPTKVVLAFDRPNWRRYYTESDVAVTRKVYKGNRRQDMTQKQKDLFQLFMRSIGEFEDIMRDHTSIIVLAKPLLEADDLISGIVKKFQGTTNEVVIITSDSDMLQLLKSDNIKIISPVDGKEMTLARWNNDWKWFIFVKCFRGDRTDNVESALPRVRETRLKKAFTDEYERIKIMKETWSRPCDVNEENQIKYNVQDLFYENQLLMDLTKQPEEIQQLIDETINEGFTNPGSFSMFHFLKFCGSHDLKKISNNVQKYIDMLSCK